MCQAVANNATIRQPESARKPKRRVCIRGRLIEMVSWWESRARDIPGASPVRFKQASWRVGVPVAAAEKAGRRRYRAHTVVALLLRYVSTHCCR